MAEFTEEERLLLLTCLRDRKHLAETFPVTSYGKRAPHFYAPELPVLDRLIERLGRQE